MSKARGVSRGDEEKRKPLGEEQPAIFLGFLLKFLPQVSSIMNLHPGSCHYNRGSH